jgi:L-gulonolactone oxidase
MSNVGSISDQTLAGIVATASHGSGWNYGVMSEMVEEMHVCLVESGEGEKGGVRVVKCSRQENEELFLASL